MGREVLDQQLNRPEHWGSTKSYGKPWADGQVRPVLQKPPYRARVQGRSEYCVPQVQSLLLIANQKGLASASGNFAFRWVLSVGSGGARAEVKLDMLNTQQISVSGENIAVSLVCEKVDPTQSFDEPTGVVIDAAVTIADGNVSSGQSTYTQGVTVAPLTSVTLPIPAMATAFRITGRDTALSTNPFVAAFSAKVNTAYVSLISEYIGTKLNQYNGDFIPMPGVARSLVLVNSGAANTIECGVQWGLDL